MVFYSASWHVDEKIAARAAAATLQVAQLFDASATLRHSTWQGETALAWCGSDGVAENADEIRITEGLRLPGDDGQHNTLHATPHSLAIANDPIGFLPLYHARVGDGHLVANRVEIIARALELTTLDLAAAAAFLSVGWVTGSRTLLAGVAKLPGGTRWALPGERHAQPWQLARRQGRVDVGDLAEQLVSMCCMLTGDVEAPLTAGRDSRLIAALLRAAGTRVKYSTEGPDGHVDVEGARQLAALLDVDHTVHAVDQNVVRDQWGRLARQLVAQNDGMISLWQISNAVRQPSTRPAVTLTGIGGEIARGFYTRPDDLLPGRAGGSVERFVIQRTPRAVLNTDAHHDVRASVRSFAAGALAKGFTPGDVRDVFYLRERVGRWAAASSRKAWPSAPFGPLLSRAWVEAAFTLTPAQRWCEPLHHRLLRHLAPQLLHIDGVGTPWRPQRPTLNILTAAARRATRRHTTAAAAAVTQETLVTPAMREAITTRILDDASSQLWHIIDRAKLAAAPTSTLLAAATLFEYENFRVGRTADVGGTAARP